MALAARTTPPAIRARTTLFDPDLDAATEERYIAELRREDAAQAALESVGMSPASAAALVERDPDREDERGLREARREETHGGRYDEAGGWM